MKIPSICRKIVKADIPRINPAEPPMSAISEF